MTTPDDPSAPKSAAAGSAAAGSAAGASPRRGRALTAWVDSIGLIGPGLPDWPTAAAVLRGGQPFVAGPVQAVLPPILPSAERRRTGVAVRVALAAGHQATSNSTFDARELASVFASSGGDGDNCHAICETLASDDRLISPTRFHNSVHNAPSGYWGIAMGARAASTSLCALDGSFAAGLLDALAQMVATGRPVVLVAYDAPYPRPLFDVRPIQAAFGLALVLAPGPTPRALGRIDATLGDDDATTLADPALEALRTSIPTARALPLLQALACHATRRIAIDYLDGVATGAPARRLLVAVSAG